MTADAGPGTVASDGTLSRDWYDDVPVPSDRTVLVTGGGGFIGSHLVDALAPENEVRVLDDFSTGERERVDDRATVIAGDVCDSDVLERAIAGVDCVFHQAAQVSVERSIAAPRASLRTNAAGTLAVLEAARDAGTRVVAASSCAIYGAPDRVPVQESAAPEPRSPYAIDKLAADGYVRRYATLHDVPTVALRYFNVYGPRGSGGQYSGVIDIFRRQAAAGSPLTVEGDGSQTRDFVHVADIVRANCLAATTDAVGRAFNVGTGRETAIRDLAETVRENADSDARIVHEAARPADIQRSCADLERARDVLGYEPRVSLPAGLESLGTPSQPDT